MVSFCGLLNRRMSPIAATIPPATARFTPVIAYSVSSKVTLRACTNIAFTQPEQPWVDARMWAKFKPSFDTKELADLSILTLQNFLSKKAVGAQQEGPGLTAKAGAEQ
jgi:hypothetical protein